MVKKKRMSKRVTLKDKFKVERKVRDHHRKQRKEERDRISRGLPGKKTKELGLPNLMPFREKFIAKMKEEQDREKEYEKNRIMNLHYARQGKLQNNDNTMEDDDDEDMKEEGSNDNTRNMNRMAENLENTEQRARAFEERQAEREAEEEETNQVGKSKKRSYMKELRTVVDAADVVLLVVDARDPMGCRAPQAEKMVMENAKTKRLIVILNKIDLVPKSVVEKWLTELRKEYPTVAFRASTQKQKSNLGRAVNDSIGVGASDASAGMDSVGDGVCVGADTLLQLLKNYSRMKDIKNSITVGIVGYPNVGKSSVINSLKRCRAVGVSPTPGFTKNLQYVQLDKMVQLIDSPGVLFQDSTQGMNSKTLVLRNCLSPAALDDPVAPVEQLLKMVNSEPLLAIYKMPRFQDATEFLVALAKSRGKLSRRGIPDLNAAARIVLQDFNCGKIPYFVEPPKAPASRSAASAKIVDKWSKEFDLEALMRKEQSELVEHLEDDMDEDDFVVVSEE